MKTIYFYGIDNNKGGMETYSFNLITKISEIDNTLHFHLITQYNDFYYKDQLTKLENFSFSVVPSRKKHPFKYTREIKKILSNRNKNDLLHLNLMSYRNFFLMHAVKKSKIKTLIMGHSTNTNNFINKIEHLLGRKIYKNLGSKIANNELVADYMYGTTKNVKIIATGIDKKYFEYNKEKRASIRNQLKIDDTKFVLGNVGRLSKEKNQLFLLKLMKSLKNENLTLFLLGNGNQKKYVNYIKRHKISNVQLIGQVENISDYYNAFDLFLFPSKFESAGFALYEALTNGCPSIISNKIPLYDINKAKLKILDFNQKKWVNTIKEIIKNYDKIIRKTDPDACPSIEKQIREYYNLYNELIK